MVEITLLGEQSVVDPVGVRTLTRSSRSIALLGLLIARTDSPQSRSTIAGAFWPESSERQALTNLRRELHHLRRLIDDDSLEVTPAQLCWHDRGHHRVDLSTFLLGYAAAVGADDDEAVVQHGTEALRQYAGTLLPGMEGDWLDDARGQLAKMVVELCDLVCAAAEREHRLDVAADAMYKRIFVDAYDEPAYRRLMEIQAANGDRTGALRTYHRLSGLLELELGVSPDPATTKVLAGFTRGEEDTTSPPAGNRSGPARAALIGRAQELVALVAAWRRAAGGRAGVVLVRGGAGVGKSRLVSELESRVRRDGAVVALGRCFESNGRLSLAPVSDWLRAPAIAAARGRCDPVWRREAERLVPAPEDGRPTVDRSAPAEHSPWQQQRFFEGVARTLLAADRPTLLVLDNLQWCDADTLSFVTVLLNLAPDTPLLVAATARENAEVDNAAAASWLAGLRQDSKLAEVRLRPFEVSQTAELAGSLTGTPPTAGEADLLQDTTGGFPLFVVEAARASLVSEADPSQGVTVWSEILSRRLHQTTTDAQETAGLASALGRDFSLPLLVEASDLDEESVVLAVDELWRHRILREIADGYDFSHDLVRDAAYQAVSPPRRWLLHRRLAQALELLNAGQPDAVAAQLGEQYRLAGNHDRASAYYMRAAESSEAVFAHAEALTLLHAALDELSALPEGRDRDQRELSCRVSAVQMLLALYGYTPTELEDNLLRIIELGQRLGRPEEHITANGALFGTIFVRGRMREALEIARRGARLTGPGDVRYGQAQHILGGAALHVGLILESSSAFEIAHTEVGADEFSSFHVLAPVFVGCWWPHALWARQLPELADQRAAEAVRMARSSGYIPSLVVSLAYGGITYQLLGDDEMCARYAHEVLTLCQRYHLSYYVEWGRVLEGWCRGESGAAELREGIAALRASNALARMPYWLALLAEITPEVSAARTVLDEAVTCASATEESLWLPELWRRQAALLPLDDASALLMRAEALAEEQGNLAVLARCRADLTNRQASAEAPATESLSPAKEHRRDRNER
jgi:DNA-binding SARP family transcriptional activator/tetratricopeptide (TPR) repeat protein